MTARKLPQNIRDLLLMWELCGRNFAATAEHYDVDESSVRHRVNRYLDSIDVPRDDNRRYSKLPLEELYLAHERGESWASLGRRYNVNANSLRRAVVRYRERMTREG